MEPRLGRLGMPPQKKATALGSAMGPFEGGQTLDLKGHTNEESNNSYSTAVTCSYALLCIDSVDVQEAAGDSAAHKHCVSCPIAFCDKTSD